MVQEHQDSKLQEQPEQKQQEHMVYTPEVGALYNVTSTAYLGMRVTAPASLKKTNTKAARRVMGVVQGCSGAWRDGSAVMSPGCSSMGPRFNS